MPRRKTEEELIAIEEIKRGKAISALFDGYLAATKYLRDVAAGKLKPSEPQPDIKDLPVSHAKILIESWARGFYPDRSRLDACKFLIEQERGRAKQMMEHTGKGGGPIKTEQQHLIVGNGNLVDALKSLVEAGAVKVDTN